MASCHSPGSTQQRSRRGYRIEAKTVSVLYTQMHNLRKRVWFEQINMSLKKKTSKKFSGGTTAASAARGGAGALPDPLRGRLLDLFGQIEKEFELLYAENTSLREKLDTLNEKMEVLMNERAAVAAQPGGLGLLDSHPSSSSTPLRKTKSTASNKKLKSSSKKSGSGLKPAPPDCSYVCTYSGHRDGVWQVAWSRHGLPLIGSASADGTAYVWEVNSCAVLLKYTGHTGSVNSIAFHPSEQIACTGSGDTTAHIWKCAVSFTEKQSVRHDSSGEEKGLSDDELTSDQSTIINRQPLSVLTGHKAPVISCDWTQDGTGIVTASWDHTARLWDAETNTVIHTLAGHDQELTHVSSHPGQQLMATSSHDTTFRLWDFRSPPIHSVSVFQGHSKAVSSAVFSTADNIISASDDHTVKIWDCRNIRSPLATIRVDCGINRISVSHDHQLLAVPLDNRNIRLYDLSGNRVAHLPHRNHLGHVRMVHSVAWSHDTNSLAHDKCNLFSAGFDNQVIGWKIAF